MKVKKIVQIFWLPFIVLILLIVVIGADFYFKRKSTEIQKLTEAEIANLKEKKELLFMLENLEILAPDYERYVKRVSSFRSNLEAEAFLRKYLDKIIQVNNGQLIKCEIIFSTLPNASLKIAQVAFLSEFRSYLKAMKLLKILEGTFPVCAIKRVEMKKQRKKINLGVECEFAYK